MSTLSAIEEIHTLELEAAIVRRMLDYIEEKPVDVLREGDDYFEFKSN